MKFPQPGIVAESSASAEATTDTSKASYGGDGLKTSADVGADLQRIARPSVALAKEGAAQQFFSFSGAWLIGNKMVYLRMELFSRYICLYSWKKSFSID